MMRVKEEKENQRQSVCCVREPKRERERERERIRKENERKREKEKENRKKNIDVRYEATFIHSVLRLLLSSSVESAHVPIELDVSVMYAY